MPGWQIFSAIALRKLPEIMPRMNPVELRVQQIFNAWELSKSKLSDHEQQHLEDLRQLERPDLDHVTKETAQDREDKWCKEKSEFQFGEHNERLSYVQYLFLKQKFSSDIKDQWLLPQASYDVQQDQNLLDTARRALREQLNIVNGYRIVSKIPSSVYSFRYPKKIVGLTGYRGAKVFFLKAQLDHPNPSVIEAVDDEKNSDKLKWLTNEEARSIVNKNYMTSFDKGLLHEKRVDISKVYAKAARYVDKLQAQMELASREA